MSHQKIKNVMTNDVATLRESTPFKEIVRLLESRGVSAMPVVDTTGRVLGIVSRADLLIKQGDRETEWTRSLLTWPSRRRDARRARATTAGQLMTRPVITIGPDDTVAAAARVLSRHDIKRLPVVDTDGRLVGIVSRRDLLTVFLRTDEDIRADVVENVFEVGLGMAVSPATVKVTVNDGEVILDGQVEYRSQLPIAEQLTRHVDGVVDVASSLTYRHDDTHAHLPLPEAMDAAHERWRDRPTRSWTSTSNPGDSVNR
jgi:CBS domain-containing protein